MAVYDGQGASQICRRFLSAYLEAQNLELALKYMAPDVEMIGGDSGEVLRGREAVRCALAGSRPMRSQGFDICSQELYASEPACGCSMVMGRVKLTARNDDSERTLCVSALCRCGEGGWLLVSLHLSWPDVHEELERGNGVLRSLLDEAACAAAVLSAGGSMRYCNAAMCGLTGVSGSDCARMPGGVARLFAAEDEAVLTRAMKRACAGTARVRLRLADGQREVSAELTALGGGELCLLVRDAAPGFGGRLPEHMLASMSCGVAEFEISGGIVRCLSGNAGFALLRDCADECGRVPLSALEDCVHADDREAFAGLFAALETGAQTAEVSFRRRRRDGEYRWINLKAREHSSDGKRRSFFGLYTDIDAARAECERRCEARLRHELRQLPVAVAAFVPGGEALRQEFCTEEWEKLLNVNGNPPAFAQAALPPGAQGGKLIGELMDGARRCGGEARMRAALLDGRQIELRARCAMDGGDGREMLLVAAGECADDGELQSRYRALAEGLSLFTFDYYPAQDLLYYRSDGARSGAVMGYSGVAPCDLAILPEHMEACREALRNACSRPSRGAVDFMYRGGSSEYRWVRAAYVSCADDDGNVIRVSGRLTDLQAEKEREERLIQVARRESTYRRALTSGALMALGFDAGTGNRLVAGWDLLPEGVPSDITLYGLLELLRDRCVHPDERRLFTATMYRYGDAPAAGREAIECRMASLTGAYDGYRWVSAEFSSAAAGNAGSLCVFICVRDIDERKRHELYNEQRANIEPITGLMNADAMRNMCAGMELSDAACGAEKALALIGIFGCGASGGQGCGEPGEGALTAAADALRALSREGELICSMGGGEFGVLMSVRGDENILRERLRILCMAIEQRLHTGAGVHVRAGAAIAPRDAGDISGLFRLAGRALDHARAQDDVPVAIYAPCMEGCAQRSRSPTQALPPEMDLRVYIRTFGYFDVFVKGRAVMFGNAKAKEMLALLVDRGGGFMSAAEMIAALWPGDDDNAVTKARCRKTAMRLKNILSENGIGDIFETNGGRRRVVLEKLDCDYVRYLTGAPEYRHLFAGTYLSEYAWAEKTLTRLRLRGAEDERDR